MKLYRVSAPFTCQKIPNIVNIDCRFRSGRTSAMPLAETLASIRVIKTTIVTKLLFTEGILYAR